MLFRGAMAKIETEDIDASSDELGDGVVRIAGGSDGCDDFGSSNDLWVHVNSHCCFNSNALWSKSRLCFVG